MYLGDNQTGNFQKMGTPVTLNIILMVLNVANVLCHSIGINLLNQLKRNGVESVQNIYVKNLSIAELFLNTVVLLDRFSKIFPRNPAVAYIISKVHYYLLILVFTGIALVYYFMMFYLTLDKLFEVYLNLRYAVYWNERKAGRLVKTTWLFGLVTSLSISIAHAYNGFCFEFNFSMYVYPLLNISFILTAVTVYCYLFHVYKETRNIPIVQGSGHVTKPKLYDVFRGSTFYIPVCLILSFLVLFVIPSLVFGVYGITKGKLSQTMVVGLWICEATSTLVDAFIYVFMMKAVRKLFCQMFHISKRRVELNNRERYYDPGIAIVPNIQLNISVYRNNLDVDGVSSCSSTETFVITADNRDLGKELALPNQPIFVSYLDAET